MFLFPGNLFRFLEICKQSLTSTSTNEIDGVYLDQHIAPILSSNSQRPCFVEPSLSSASYHPTQLYPDRPSISFAPKKQRYTLFQTQSYFSNSSNMALRAATRLLCNTAAPATRSVSTFTLPELKYAYAALEPHFDEKTMTVGYFHIDRDPLSRTLSPPTTD